MKLSDKWIKAGKEENKIRYLILERDTAFDRGSSLRWKHRTTSYILLCIHIRPPRLSIYRSAVQRARARARVCVTIFNLATICKHDATRRSANNSQGEFTRRRNPRSTSLLVIAYDSHRALCSSTYVRFSLLSFPPSIVLSYAPFRSSLGFPPIYRPLDPCPILFHDGNIKHFSFSFPPIREQ